jgi:hypothetical protein
MSHPETPGGPSSERNDGAPPNRSPQERKVDDERREIERGVYERRTAGDQDVDTGEGVEANPSAYEPSTVEVNRGRGQGLGVGQKDIDYQRDATGAPSADKYGKQ